MGVKQFLTGLVGHDTWVARRFRPVREWTLDRAYRRAGLPLAVNGVPVRVNPRYRWYFQPDYDAPVAAFLRDRVRPGMTCVSVGANLGVYPLQFASWSAPGGTVYAFEPNPDTAAVLRTHVRMNGLEGRVRVVERAVADRPGTGTFHVAGVDGMSRLGKPNALLTGTRAIEVPVDTLDEFFSREGTRPDVLTVDVEGFEAAVLRGARGLFTAAKAPVAVVEMHPQAWGVAGTDREVFAALLSDLRVRAVPLSGQADPLADYGHIALESTAP